MIDLISPGHSKSDLYQPTVSFQSGSLEQEVDTTSAEEEVLSLYYLSSIQSLQVPMEQDKEKETSIQTDKVEGSTFQRLTTWFWGLFGSGNSSKALEATSEEGVNSREDSSPEKAPSSVQLPLPEEIDHKRLAKAIADINKDLLYRLKDTAEFEVEMLNSNSNTMDRLILLHIVSKSLEQKKLKEEFSLDAHEGVLDLQKQNKKLTQTYYNLLKEIRATAKTNTLLHWINIGTTVGIAGTLAVGFATGGAGTVFAIALPALNILKGGLSATEGSLKYKNDLRTGKMTLVNHDVKSNRNLINDKVSITLPYADEEISNLMKTIRHHLENYNKEARFNPQSN